MQPGRLATSVFGLRITQQTPLEYAFSSCTSINPYEKLLRRDPFLFFLARVPDFRTPALSLPLF
ncbi:hypothetical protein ACLOJK_014395 [Asimina triloba]